jgi:imidazolonepropionase-like amidohydrolase
MALEACPVPDVTVLISGGKLRRVCPAAQVEVPDGLGVTTDDVGGRPETVLRWRDMLAFLKMLHDAGGKLITGTDTGISRLLPGATLHGELAIEAAAGINPLKIIRCASLEPAEAMRPSHDQGSLVEGKRANASSPDG